MEYLEGGRVKKIKKIGKNIYRPISKATPLIHKLLLEIHSKGFLKAPIPIGVTENGDEIVSYISGEVYNKLLPNDAKSDEALISVAKLMREYHDATVNFAMNLCGDEKWMLPAKKPIEVMCHGDFAPYNIVMKAKKAIGIIDFDTVHPGPRLWDIAYALYRWVPLMAPDNPENFGVLENKKTRIKIFCDSYRLKDYHINHIIEYVRERMKYLVDLMIYESETGNETFTKNIKEGHHLLYLKDINYLENFYE